MLPDHPTEQDNTDLSLQTIKNPSIEHLEDISNGLDSLYRIPLTNKRFGYDVILGLLPGIGDGASTAISGYIIFQAYRLGAPIPTLLRMVVNVGIDFLIGLLPIIGTLADWGWKANNKNIDLLQTRIQKPQTATQDVTFLLRYVLPAIIIAVILIVGFFVLLFSAVWNAIQSSEILRAILFYSYPI
jgi:hypothetical protein